MAIQTLQWGGNPGGSIGQGLGTGISEALSDLAQIKMQEYATRQRSALEEDLNKKAQIKRYNDLEAAFGPGWGKLSVLPEKMALAALQGNWRPNIANAESTVATQGKEPMIENGLFSMAPTSDLGAAIARAGQNTPALQIASAKLALAKKAQEQKESQFFDKKTEAEYEKAKGKAESAEENLLRFGRMKELISKGDLPSPAWESALDLFATGFFGKGIDLRYLLGADANEFRKLSTDMLKSAKEIFGTRITDTDLKAFLQTIPTLSMSDDGKMRVIRNLELMSNAQIAKRDIMNEIIEANEGLRPKNFEVLVQKKYAPVQEKLYKEFISNVRQDSKDNPIIRKRKLEKSFAEPVSLSKRGRELAQKYDPSGLEELENKESQHSLARLINYLL